MTPEQRAALDKLPPKRRTFVLAYLRSSNATDAAREAEYAKPKQEGCRLLTIADVRQAIDAFRVPAEDAAVMELEELRAFWTSVARGEVDDWEEHLVRSEEGTELVVEKARAKLKDRLKATELLGKSLGAFVERREVTGANGGAHEVVIRVRDERDASRMRELARGGGE